jgi:hypothetical protein
MPWCFAVKRMWLDPLLSGQLLKPVAQTRFPDPDAPRDNSL